MLSRLNKKSIWNKELVWKCKEIFCYWAKVSSEEWWSICFSFVPPLCISPFEGKYFCRNRSSGFGAKLQIPSDFPDLSCFSPAQNNMHNFLVKNLFSHFIKLFSNLKKWKQHVSNFYKNPQFPLVLLLAWSKSHWPRVCFKLIIERAYPCI